VAIGIGRANIRTTKSSENRWTGHLEQLTEMGTP